MELFLRTFFLVNSKETVLPGSCLQQVLKYCTAKYYTVKYWESITIPCALQIGFSEKVKNVQEKCQCRSPVSVMLNCDFIIARLHHGYVQECSYFFHNLYLFSEPINNHCFDRAVQGQLSKCNRRNTITTISSLIQSSWLKQNKKELNKFGDT